MIRLVAIVILVLSVAAGADTCEQMVLEAIGEYTRALNEQDQDLRSERFRRAQRLFRQAIENGNVENADLYLNLGNASLQAEQTGQAILAYRRALVIEPGHDRARQNLAYTRQLLPDWVPRPEGRTLLDTFLFFYQTLSLSGRTLAAALCFLTSAILLAVAIRWKKPWARNTAAWPAVVWLALTGLSMWDRWSTTADEVVVTTPQVIARSADSAGAPPRFVHPLPAGTEATVLERRAGWVRVRLANSRDAWVRTSSVTSVSSKS